MAEDITNQAASLSDEELQQRLDKLEAYYDSQLPLLRKRHEYEKLTSEIEEFRFRGLVSKLKMMDLQKPQGDDNTESKPKPNEDGAAG